jgi:hypothetical protein
MPVVRKRRRDQRDQLGVALPLLVQVVAEQDFAHGGLVQFEVVVASHVAVAEDEMRSTKSKRLQACRHVAAIQTHSTDVVTSNPLPAVKCFPLDRNGPVLIPTASSSEPFAIARSLGQSLPSELGPWTGFHGVLQP